MPTNAPPAMELEAALRASGVALTAGDAAYAVDGLTPAFVVTPGSVDQLSAVLAGADAVSAATVPWGGGRHMTLGNVPSRYDLALRTAKLDRVIEYEPADLTVTVEAGITFGALQRRLAEHGQFLPIDAPADATVGGVLAANVSGASRHAYGLPRDWLIGCKIVRADGTVFKGGGRVVKNVAGYDLPKLAVGSLGTLGVIAEATFKLAPLPRAQETLLVRSPSLDEAAGLVFAADERGLVLRAVALRQARDGTTAAFWLAGAQAAVERTRREIEGLSRGANAERLEGRASDAWWSELTGEHSPAGGLSLRATLLPSDVAAFCKRLIGDGGSLVAYPTTGLVLGQAAAASMDALVALIERERAAAAAVGGSLVVSEAPAEVKRRIDMWGPAEALPLMRRLKEQFDPRATLNPGRLIGGI